MIDRMLDPGPAKRIGMHETAERLRRFERPSASRRVWKVAALAALATVAVVALLWLYRVRAGSQIDLSGMTVRPLALQPGRRIIHLSRPMDSGYRACTGPIRLTVRSYRFIRSKAARRW